ncbi:MAG: ABC transporter permease [Phycisphaerae bacterium]|nr:ABC transporter permease [Phycisphaerae bacterium]
MLTTRTMGKILKIARREYGETVRTKTFIIGLLVAPLLIGVIMFVSVRSAIHNSTDAPAKRIAITDLTGELSEKIASNVYGHNQSTPKRQMLVHFVPADPNDLNEVSKLQKQKLQLGALDLYVIIDPDVTEDGKLRFYSRARKAPDIALISMARGMLQAVIVQRRCELQNLSPQLLAELRRRVPVEHVEVSLDDATERTRSDTDKIVGMMLPFFFIFMMFMGIFGMGQHMVSSVIEEKNSRVIEVLISAVSPFELMSGKILGLGAIGLTVMGIWTAVAYGAARARGIDINIPPALLGYFVLYYVLGFMLFSSIQAGIGSLCNTIKEAQSLMMPLSIIIIIPMLSWMSLVRNPEGTLAQVLSYVPLLTPMIMILRICAGDNLSAFQIIAPTVVLIASVPAVIWISARIFRTGILMYGKRPGIKEIARWIKQR